MRINLLLIMLLALFTITTTACKKEKGDKADVTETKNKVAKASKDAKTYTINANNSKVKWWGSKPSKTHNGSINVKSGSFAMKNGNIESGSFEIDMTSLVVEDLEGKMKANLEGHLKGTVEGKEKDFFNISEFPTSKFEITKVTKVANNDNATHLIYGNLTIKDITKQVGFQAKVDNKEGKIIATTKKFKIDRTDWDIQFMSNKFFDDLKDNFIEDEFEIRLRLVANAS
ncbi:MAG: YceI family protein [Saprospiraceae bacterium]|nr:YceI family protein [Saprospiraceae bacterium]